MTPQVLLKNFLLRGNLLKGGGNWEIKEIDEGVNFELGLNIIIDKPLRKLTR